MAGMNYKELNHWLDGRLKPLESRVKRYIEVEARAEVKTQGNSLRRRISSVEKSFRKLRKKGAYDDVAAAAPRPFKPSNNERIAALEEENRKLRQENEQLRQKIQEVVERHDARYEQHAAQIEQLVEQQKAVMQRLSQAGVVAADPAVPL